MMKILIADALAPAIVAQLKADGTCVEYDPSVVGHEILVVRRTKVTRDVIAAGAILGPVTDSRGDWHKDRGRFHKS
jgi:hypothetical protein